MKNCQAHSAHSKLNIVFMVSTLASFEHRFNLYRKLKRTYFCLITSYLFGILCLKGLPYGDPLYVPAANVFGVTKLIYGTCISLLSVGNSF